MAKTDWTLTDTVKPDDFNNIGREINQLRMDVDHIEVPTASLTEAGIVQLSNATNSTSETQAATSKAVKAAYDACVAAQTRADQAFQAGNERKAEVVAALVAWGISASTSESWDSLIAKLTAIVNRGAQVITPGTTNKAIPAGYHNGKGYVVGEPNLVTGNLPKDKTFWGIVGALERMTTAEKQAISNAITGKGVAASASDTNTILAQKIGQIITGKRYASGSGTQNTIIQRKMFTRLNAEPREEYYIRIESIPFVPSTIILRGGEYGNFSAYFSEQIMSGYSRVRMISLSKITDLTTYVFVNEPLTGPTYDIPVQWGMSTFTFRWEAFG